MEWDWGDIYLIFIYIYFPTATLNHWSDGPMATPWPHGFAGDALCAREGGTKAAQLKALRGFTYENSEFQELCDVMFTRGCQYSSGNFHVRKTMINPIAGLKLRKLMEIALCFLGKVSGKITNWKPLNFQVPKIKTQAHMGPNYGAGLSCKGIEDVLKKHRLKRNSPVFCIAKGVISSVFASFHQGLHDPRVVFLSQDRPPATDPCTPD